MDISISIARSSQRRRWRATAFTLVEVTLALGIFTFAITAIFGLLPLGMNAFRQALDTSISSQICQRVFNDAQQTDFNTLTSTPVGQVPVVSNKNIVLPLRYFDNEGTEVATVGGTAVKAYLYVVNTVVTPSTAMPNTAKFANLATVVVQIVNNPGQARTISTSPDTSLWNDRRFAIATYSGTVPRNQ